ncbi:GNAT family N-acetyltransferase [Flindersiella endophytica]
MPAVLTDAFQDDPVIAWLFPDPADRRNLQPLYYTALLRQPTAEAYLTGDPGDAAGAAVWLDLGQGQTPFDQPPPGTGPDPLAAFGRNAGRLVTLGGLLAERHPHDQAHLYLACIGVRPARRGTGLGSALLRQRLNRADGEAKPAYLEASSARSRELYLRHGFADLGTPIQLPDAGPTLWPMWRDPAQLADRNPHKNDAE